MKHVAPGRSFSDSSFETPIGSNDRDDHCLNSVFLSENEHQVFVSQMSVLRRAVQSKLMAKSGEGSVRRAFPTRSPKNADYFPRLLHLPYLFSSWQKTRVNGHKMPFFSPQDTIVEKLA